MKEKEQNTKKKRAYLEYFKTMKAKGRQPKPYGVWSRMKALGKRASQAEKSLEGAGLSERDIARLRGKR